MVRSWALLVALLCGNAVALNASAASQANLLTNPSFEKGRQGWEWRQKNPHWNNFELSPDQGLQSGKAALMPMRYQADKPSPAVWGLVQKKSIRELPRELSFSYRVENWQRAVPRQYIQVVVMIHDDKLVSRLQHNTMQLRYIVAGTAAPPYENIVNARYVMAGTREPFQGRWIQFKADLPRDFKRVWGWAPKDFSALEIFFEVRYDDAVEGSVRPRADVYWDEIKLMY